MTTPDVDHVMALERELQTRACRADPERVRALLADDFSEVGASGRVWDVASTLAMLREESGDAVIEVHDLMGRSIAAGFVLLRWDSKVETPDGVRRARRTSLWRREGVGWRLVHHQGTPLTA